MDTFRVAPELLHKRMLNKGVTINLKNTLLILNVNLLNGELSVRCPDSRYIKITWISRNNFYSSYVTFNHQNTTPPLHFSSLFFIAEQLFKNK